MANATCINPNKFHYSLKKKAIFLGFIGSNWFFIQYFSDTFVFDSERKSVPSLQWKIDAVVIACVKVSQSVINLRWVVLLCPHGLVILCLLPKLID